MTHFVVLEVNDKYTDDEFIDFHYSLYKKDTNWIPPIKDDIREIFSPKTNVKFQNGKLKRWIVQNTNKETVGRIAAFIDNDNAYMNDQPTGGIGFFDSINDPKVAKLLFDISKEWLQENGMEAMDGSINFGSRERWWGVLVDGFSAPSYGMNHNYPYYKGLFEDYGFKNYFNQYSYKRELNMENVSPLLKEKADRIARNPDYRIEKISLKNIKKLKKDFRNVYNKAWTGHSGIKEMSEKDVNKIVEELQPIIDERLIHFAYYKDEAVGFYIQIPDLNQVFEHLNGKFGVFHKLKFLYLLKVKKICTRISAIIFGVVPEHRAVGLEGALVSSFANEVFSEKHFQYTEIVLSWIGDFNPLMMRFQDQIGGKVYKTHVTYRLLFNLDKQENEFKRCPRMGKERKTKAKTDAESTNTVKKLVFATNNKDKIAEVQNILPDYKILSPSDLGLNEDIPEDQNTLEGNSLQKAQYISEKLGIACFADDTGLEVEALNGAPGVYSARYAGTRDMSLNIEKLLSDLKGKENRQARFRCVITFIDENKKTHVFDGTVEGKIIEELKGDKGFGYDPVFQAEDYNCTFAEMEFSEKNKKSHRKKAVQKLADYLNSLNK